MGCSPLANSRFQMGVTIMGFAEHFGHSLLAAKTPLNSDGLRVTCRKENHTNIKSIFLSYGKRKYSLFHYSFDFSNIHK